MSSTRGVPSIVPAQLSYLAIYNPAFGDTDETAYEQIFYYYSRDDDDLGSSGNASGKNAAETDAEKRQAEEDTKNQRLRRVGLARGLVEFAK